MIQTKDRTIFLFLLLEKGNIKRADRFEMNRWITLYLKMYKLVVVDLNALPLVTNT